MSYLWSFSPDETYVPTHVREYKPKKKGDPANAWVAPEHVRLSQDMRRDYPRDGFGRRIDGKPRELVIDKRPKILVPPRPTRIGWL